MTDDFRDFLDEYTLQIRWTFTACAIRFSKRRDAALPFFHGGFRALS